jgi:hypothetical protein
MTPLLLLALLQAAVVPTVTAKPSKTDVTVGESFTVEVSASGPSGSRFSFAPEAGNEQIELRTPPVTASTAPLAVGVWRYEAAVFAIGDVSVPPIKVQYTLPDGTGGEVVTEAVPLRVLSVLPKERGEQKLADIRPPQPLAVGAAFWVACSLALALLAGLGWWLLRRRRRPVPAPHVPEVSPAEEARAALDALAASGALAGGEFRRFYIELSEIAKRYLERRLGAPILEMTSAEMHGFLREHAHGREFATPLRELAGAADAIKFARGHGALAEAERHLRLVRELVAALEQRLAPKPEPKPA